MRLLCPQCLFNKKKGVKGKFEGDDDSFCLHFKGYTQLIVDYDSRNHFFIRYASISARNSLTTSFNQTNLTLLDKDNRNLTAGQKLLLNWHNRFGHLNFLAAQHILHHFPFVSGAFTEAAKCNFTDLKCEICQYAKAHQQPAPGRKLNTNVKIDGSLKAEHLSPGAKVPVDHFESRLLGRMQDLYGKELSEK
jgi:hypothetical protein